VGDLERSIQKQGGIQKREQRKQCCPDTGFHRVQSTSEPQPYDGCVSPYCNIFSHGGVTYQEFCYCGKGRWVNAYKSVGPPPAQPDGTEHGNWYPTQVGKRQEEERELERLERSIREGDFSLLPTPSEDG